MIVLLEVNVGGRIRRYATEACTVMTAAGEALVYEEGLADPGLSFASAFGAGDASVSVSVSTDTDWNEVIADGHALDQRPATLRRWAPGTVLERARVLIRGLTATPIWGSPEEGLQLTINRTAREQTVTLPDAQAVVDFSTWPNASEADEGSPYTIVIGAPGHTESATPTPCVPVPQVIYIASITTARSDSFVGPPALYTLTYTAIPSSVKVTVNGLKTSFFIATATTVSIQIPFIVGGDVIDIDYDEYDTSATNSTIGWVGGNAGQARVLAVEQSGVQSEFDFPVLKSADGLGRELAICSQSYPLAVTYLGSSSDKYYVGFRDDTVYGGGLERPVGGGLLRGAGDVIEWVLGQYDGAVDVGRVAAAKTVLNRYKIDTWISSPVNLWDWLRNDILPLLPVEMREGTEGVYPAVLRYDLTAADAVASLVEGEGVDRAGPIRLTTEDIANEITVRFRPTRSGGWATQRTITAQPKTVSRAIFGLPSTVDVRVTPYSRCADSQARYGVRPLVVEAFAVWDAGTAVLLGTHLADRLALPRRRVTYVGDATLERLDVGSAILLTSSAIGLTQAVCRVEDVTPSATDVSVELLVL